MSTTIVDRLDGASYECAATTVEALKEAYESEHGVPVDTQEVWAFSSGRELDNAATLADEDNVQLVIDQQTVTVLFEDQPHEVKCAHESTVGDVCQTLKAKQGFTDVVFALDANAMTQRGSSRRRTLCRWRARHTSTWSDRCEWRAFI